MAAAALEVAARLNARFRLGRPSNDLAAAGVLLHQLDGYEDQKQPWLPCDMGDGPKGACSVYQAAHWSGSLVNKAQRGVYATCHGGLVFAPVPAASAVECAYPRDGSTQGKGCSPWCTGVRANGLTSEPNGCCWPAAQLERMLVEAASHGSDRNGHNEVVVDAKEIARQLPHSIEAFVFHRTCHGTAVGQKDGKGALVADYGARREAARTNHAAFVASFPGLDAAAVPLLELDLASGSDSPFRPVA